MQSLGNDFVMLDCICQPFEITKEFVLRVSDRHFGIGCDQIIVVEETDNTNCHFCVRVFNCDGSEVGQCGNGARCFARFAHDKGLTQLNPILIKTITTEMSLFINSDNSVTANMGQPRFSPNKIPIKSETETDVYTLEVDNQKVSFQVVSMGNPHCVLTVDVLSDSLVNRIGPILQSHRFFSMSANIGFMQIVSRSEINLRVNERGAGETLGCGSGACAAVVSGIRAGKLDNRVTVNLPGGRAQVEWPGAESEVLLTGPTTTVFEGCIDFTH